VTLIFINAAIKFCIDTATSVVVFDKMCLVLIVAHKENCYISDIDA